MTKIKFVVPEAILDQTAKCLNNFSCLASGECHDASRCAVEYVAGENIIFVRPKDAAEVCPYRVAFGHSHVCRCPTHFALLQQKDCGRREPVLPEQLLRRDML